MVLQRTLVIGAEFGCYLVSKQLRGYSVNSWGTGPSLTQTVVAAVECIGIKL